MKKFYTVAAALLIAGTAYGQRATSETRTFENAPSLTQYNAESVVDTIAPTVVCASPSPSLTGSANGGYVAGTNGYGDLEKGVIFEAPSSGYDITDALVVFGAKEQVTNGSLVAYVYPLDTATGSVGAAIATSDPVSVSSIDTSLAFTEFNFSSPAYAAGFYILSVEVDNGGDTVGILHTQDGCGASTAVEKWSDGSWAALANAWPLDIQFYMFARVDANVSTEENIISATTVKAFPNPANDKVNLVYDLNSNADVTIRIMDIQGRVVKQINENQSVGAQLMEVNTSDLSAGTYFYSVQGGEQTLNGKFVVRH